MTTSTPINKTNKGMEGVPEKNQEITELNDAEIDKKIKNENIQ